MAKKRERGDILTGNYEDFKTGYRRASSRRHVFSIVAIVVAIAALFITLGLGVYKISIPDAVMVFFNHLFGTVTDLKGDLYIWDIRLPRAIGALFVGAGLAIGGAVMQNVMHNPLADPYTVGVSSGAFLGAVLSMIGGFAILPFLPEYLSTIANAFVFSLIPVAVIILISRFKRLSPTAIILLGIAMMYVFSSITQYMMISSESEDLAEVYAWRVGSLDRITWENLPLIIGITTLLGAILGGLYRKLDVMYTGDNNAKTLGVNAPRMRIVTLTLISLMTAGIVSFTGTIGFIGLVGPHIARIFVGSKNKYLLPASATFGAVFMIVADSIAKISGVNGLPVGVISSMIGGPLFLYILIKQRRKVWN